MAIFPVQLSNISVCEEKLYNQIMADYSVRLAEPHGQIDPAAEMRRELVQEFIVLTDVCYDDFLEGRAHILVTPQDVWIPRLRRVQELIGQFDDRDIMTSQRESWQKCYTVYRSWVRTCGLSRSVLANYWFSITDDDDDDDDF